jgi:WD40 repeat protein
MEIMLNASYTQINYSGSNDLLIYVWDLDALMPIFTMEGHEEWVKTVTMAGQTLISGSHDSTIKVWDLTEFTCMQTLKGHRDAVVALLAQGSIIYSGSEDNSIKVWDLNTLECVSRSDLLNAFLLLLLVDMYCAQSTSFRYSSICHYRKKISECVCRWVYQSVGVGSEVEYCNK